MEFGPSTTNAALADALDNLAHRHAKRLSAADYAALTEAVERIRERGDDEEDV